MSGSVPDISVVLPARNEAENLPGLVRDIARVLQQRRHEILVVDDGSSDATATVIAELAQEVPQLRLLRHSLSCGQSAALRSGVRAARGAIVATLDADGQNPAINLPGLIAPLEAGDPSLGLVQGQRVARHDSWSRRYASKFANWLRQSLLKDGVRDSGCGARAFPRGVYLALPFFDHNHRFMPALVWREGFRVLTVDVAHADRQAGRSNYNNLNRALVGSVDLLGVAWLTRRRKLPVVREQTLPR